MYQFHGDWAGYAQDYVEKRFPGAVALYVTGCGGDAKPAPRGLLEHVLNHGESMGRAVESAVDGNLRPISGPLRSRFETVTLRFAPPLDRAGWDAKLKDPSLYVRRHAQMMLDILNRRGRIWDSYPYPVQVWRFGDDLTLVGLAGEVVVDYALRLKREFGAEKLWVAAYCNDVFAYIPSLRVLKEGGYEGGGAMIYYGQPGPFADSVEETIIRKVHELVGRTT